MNYTKEDLKRLSSQEITDLYIDLQTLYNKQNDELEKYRESELTMPKKYNEGWTWTRKILFSLAKLDKPALATDILTLLEKYDDHFDYYNDRTRSFSYFISNAHRNGAIGKVKIGGYRGFHYCLPQWFDESGKLKRNFLHKVSILG